MKILNAINGFASPPKTILFEESKKTFSNNNFTVPVPAQNQAAEQEISPNPSKAAVETFFRENHYPVMEAKKFFYYNHGKGWQLTNKLPITDWQSLAHKWMLNDQNFRQNQNTAYGNRQKHPNLDVRTDKDYSEPL